jgi:hypothetical protein
MVLLAVIAVIVIAGASIAHFHHELALFFSDGSSGCGGG